MNKPTRISFIPFAACAAIMALIGAANASDGALQTLIREAPAEQGAPPIVIPRPRPPRTRLDEKKLASLVALAESILVDGRPSLCLEMQDINGRHALEVGGVQQSDGSFAIYSFWILHKDNVHGAGHSFLVQTDGSISSAIYNGSDVAVEDWRMQQLIWREILLWHKPTDEISIDCKTLAMPVLGGGEYAPDP